MTRTGLLRFLGAVVLTAGGATPALGHEIGTTRVAVSLQPAGTYRVEVVTDATALLEKLDASNGRAAESGLEPAAIETAIGTFDETFRRRVTIAFDGTTVSPVASYRVAPGSAASGPAATVVLTGAVPPDARELVWTYGWTFASYALSVQPAGSAQAATEWLEGGEASRPIALAALAPPPAGWLETAARYVALGFTHILPHGLDHMLFVLGLFLLSRRARPLLMQVSAFTLAHSITLGLSLYQVISVPPAIVEPLIAVSIAYVAIENIFMTDLRAWRVVLVFAFGLLHGMGFAGALGELGLPRAQFVTALVGFNVGVEAGQLAVIAAAFALVGWRWGSRDWYRHVVVVPVSAAIACVAVYWALERIHWVIG